MTRLERPGFYADGASSDQGVRVGFRETRLLSLDFYWGFHGHVKLVDVEQLVAKFGPGAPFWQTLFTVGLLVDARDMVEYRHLQAFSLTCVRPGLGHLAAPPEAITCRVCRESFQCCRSPWLHRTTAACIAMLAGITVIHTSPWCCSARVKNTAVRATECREMSFFLCAVTLLNAYIRRPFKRRNCSC